MRLAKWLVLSSCALAGCLNVAVTRPVQKVECAPECSEAVPAPVPAAPEGRLGLRLQAARAVSDPFARARLLEQLADESADAGQAEVMKQSLAGINDPFQKSRVTERCVFKLASAGQGQAAVELARGINDPFQRDRVLQALARGETK